MVTAPSSMCAFTGLLTQAVQVENVNLTRIFTKVGWSKLTVMESDLSSSDIALRMLFVEDVELLESGILSRRNSVLFLSLLQWYWSNSIVGSLSRPLWLHCAARAFLFSDRFSLLLSHLFVVSDVKHANSALINQCAESQPNLEPSMSLYKATGKSTHRKD